MRSITKSNDDGEVLNEHVETTYFDETAIVSCSYAVKRPFGVDTLYIGFSAKSLKKTTLEELTSTLLNNASSLLIMRD